MIRAGLAATIAITVASSTGLAGAAVAPSTGSFASRADTACAAAGARIVALPAPTATTVVSDLRSNRTILIKLVAQLKAIQAPASKAKAYAAFVASINQHATIIGQTLATSSATEIARLSKAVKAASARTHSEAQALGLPACAKDYKPSATSKTKPSTTMTTPVSTYGATVAVPVGAPPAQQAPAVTPAAAGAPAGSATTGGSAGASGATGSTGAAAGNSSQSGTQTFSGSSSSGQSVNTSGGGVFITG